MSNVYLVRVEDKDIAGRVSALKKILEKANPFSSYEENEVLPIKLTLGDRECCYHIKPELVKMVISELKAKNTQPFLFDTCVIYKGSRQNAVDYLNLVQAKGFGQERIGAPFVIADGVFGSDGREYEIKGKHLKKIKLPSFVGFLDSLVVLSHITGHILSGYAGAIKNVAMGISSRAGKQVQHSSLKPHIIENDCTQCSCCLKICPVLAISMKEKAAFIDKDICIGCGECICACKFDAIFINWKEDNLIFSLRMVEAAFHILSHFKNKFFINFAFDITKECDCISKEGEEIISADIGIFASPDIVSVDKATIDFVNSVRKDGALDPTLSRDKDVDLYSSPPRGMGLSNGVNKDGDVFAKAQNVRSYHKMLDYAAEIGLGNVDYNLIEC